MKTIKKIKIINYKVMHYNSGTGSYINDTLEQILDTDFYFDVPYQINKQKYNIVLEKYGEKSRMTDATIVEFSMDVDKEEDEDMNTCGYTLFVFPKNSPSESDDFYDCIQFRDYKYDNTKESFETFVKEILTSIVTPNIEYINKAKAQIYANMTEEIRQLSVLDKIIQKKIEHETLSN